MPGDVRFGSKGGGRGDVRFKGGKGKPHKKGGHGLGHLVGQTLTDFKDVAVNLPGGLYHAGGEVIHHPVRFGKEVAVSTAHDLRHPLRHPGYTALDVLGLADLGVGSLARVAEVGRAAKAGESVARAVVRGAKPQARFVKHPHTGEKVPAGTYARAASSRTFQKTLDRIREKHPNVRVGLRNQHERVGAARTRNQGIREDLSKGEPKALLKMSKRLNKSQQLSIRVVAERVPLETRIQHAEELLVSAGKEKVATQLRHHLALLKRARKYVEDVHGVPRIKPEHEHLVEVYEQAKKVAHRAEREKIDAGYLSAEGASVRKSRVAHEFDHELVPGVFKDQGFYVSYLNKRPPSNLVGPHASGGLRTPESVSVPRTPAQLTHAFTGESIRTGNINPKTTRAVAADALQTDRFLSLVNQREELGRLAKPTRTSEHDIPIRPIWLKNKPWPQEIRNILDDSEAELKPEETQTRIQALRNWVFPEAHEAAGVKGIMWVDRRDLGDLGRRELVPGETLTKALKGTDTFNNVTRLALIYGKPGYILPNLLGNVALNIVQQGLFAPANLWRAARINRKLGVHDAAAIDAGMGQGVSASIAGHTGPLHQATEKVAGVLGAATDKLPRRAAFLHAAYTEGHRTAQQLHRLLTEDGLDAERVRVFREARDAIIEFDHLRPIERDVIKRLIFLYPWVKGSTVYAGRLLREHPIQSAVGGQLGARSTRENEKVFGPLPSYLEGIFKVGQRGKNPLVVNPAAASITGTPGQVLQTARGLVGGGVGEAYQAGQMLVPGLQALGPLSRGGLKKAGSELVRQTPQEALIEALRHPPSKDGADRIYPRTREDAILKYLLGSSVPTPLNKAKANQQAEREQSGR